MVTLDDWHELTELAVRVNLYRHPEKVFDRAPAGKPAASDSPGSDFNRTGSWAETGLFDEGWTWVRQSTGDSGLLCRPGKSGAVSASVGMVTSAENGWPLFYCWSTSVVNLPVNVGVDRFGVYAKLKHAGDFRAAAKALADMGYGARTPTVTMSSTPPPTGGADQPPQPDRFFLWASELRRQAEAGKWLWQGYISRSGITLLSALWKAGKTTLLSYLIRAMDGRESTFLGLPVAPSRVLYITEEHQERWAERRDDLDLVDNIGFKCRPFRGRPSPAEWVAFVGQLVEAAVDNGFDLVILDTISKLWPVRDENDAGQVEDALRPLWALSDYGIATLLIHHDRKSGGEQFTGSRGSGGLPAFVETIMEFRRDPTAGDDTKDPKRLITGKGRYSETPDKLLIELTPAGYVAHGDPDDAAVRVTFSGQTWQAKVMAMIPATKPGISRDEIMDRLGKDGGVRKEVLAEWLRTRFEDGELMQSGLGRKGDPFRYTLVSDGQNAVPTPHA